MNEAELMSAILDDAPDSKCALFAPPWQWDDGTPHFERAYAVPWIWNNPRRAYVRKTTWRLDGQDVELSHRDIVLPPERLLSLRDDGLDCHNWNFSAFGSSLTQTAVVLALHGVAKSP